MRRQYCLALAAWLLGAGAVLASDPVGIYALVEKVVLEPNAEAPERVKIHGAFRLATPGSSDDYTEPQWGYLYYTAVRGKEDVCRKEWADLQKVAGTGDPVAFGSRHKEKGKVRRPGAEPGKPDVYPLEFGLTRLRRSESGSASALLALPAPVAPEDGGQAPAGKVTLVARNVRGTDHPNARYVFEIATAAGVKEVSEPVAAGDKETRWSPRLEVKRGESYTWRVQAVDGSWKGPVATARFKAKDTP